MAFRKQACSRTYERRSAPDPLGRTKVFRSITNRLDGTVMKAILTILILIPSTSCFPQTNVLIFSGINFPTFPLREGSFYLEEYWLNGINFGVTTEFEVNNRFSVAPSFEYNLYFFDSYDGLTAIEPGMLFQFAEGENSRIYRFLLEMKYFPEISPESKTQPFILSGLGYVVEDIGNIKAFYNVDGLDILLNPTFKSKKYLVHSIGIGIRWPLKKTLMLNLEGKIFTDYKSRFQNSWNLGLLFNI